MHRYIMITYDCAHYAAAFLTRIYNKRREYGGGVVVKRRYGHMAQEKDARFVFVFI